MTIGGNAPWPPPSCVPAITQMTELEAWYVGDPVALREYYASNPGWRHELNRPSEMVRSGGMRGFIARLWYGRSLGLSAETAGVHVPAAADIASLSADLLFAEPPTFSIDGGTAEQTERLQDILIKGGELARLSEGAELTSAYGSVFLRAIVDKAVSKYPFTDAIMPQRAVPTWRNGHLIEVTFWRTVAAESTAVYRHLERHYVESGRGYVAHALWKGSATALGEKVPLSSHPETKIYGEVPGTEGGVIPTGVDQLDVTHWPNLLPNRSMPGQPYGRSDYSASITEMDSLDFTWTALMRDVDNSRSMLMVPREYLTSLGPGNGATFDRESSLFQAVRTADPENPLQVEKVQFDIRVEQHERAAAALWRIITRAAGLSADAFGEESDGGAATATEIGARGARTLGTRRRKIGYADPALCRHIGILVELDAVHYAGSGSTRGSEVKSKWPDGVTADVMKNAQTVQLLDGARAISTWMKVKTVNPDWDDAQIKEEVDRIEGEAQPVVVQDPGSFTGAAPAEGETQPAEGDDEPVNDDGQAQT